MALMVLTVLPPSDSLQRGIAAYRGGLMHCFSHAARAGAESVAITPHLDAASDASNWSIRSWRNGIVFSPLAKYGAHSYMEVMLEPLADALGQALPPWMPIYFALQGEMGATVFR
jgi:hypothetical protein